MLALILGARVCVVAELAWTFKLLGCSSSRGVGCILYEMATGRPLFPGATVKEELHLIFRLLGEKDGLIQTSTVKTNRVKTSCRVFQALQQRKPGLESAVMRSFGPTSFLNTDLRLSSTMYPGNTNEFAGCSDMFDVFYGP